MSISELISPEGSGYFIFRLTGLGEIHLEISNRPDKENDSTMWEASVYYPRNKSGSLYTVLHTISSSRDELIKELDRALLPPTETA